MNGKKKLCTCGKTKTPPYCDHAHEHLEMKAEPVIEKQKLCTCGKTKTPPYCDHAHEHVEMKAEQLIEKRKLCTCGKTKTPPYCDHAHEYLEMKPEPVIEKRKLCTCGKTKTPPFCDHAHENIYENTALDSKTPSIRKSPITSKILLLMLPYWDPLIPPQGIAHLKHFLEHHGFVVKTDDANTKQEFKEYYNKYFDVLKKYVPKEKQGNFFNIGHDVLRNQMLAHINYNDERRYIDLVKVIIDKTFFTLFSDKQVIELKEVLEEFYKALEKYTVDLLIKERPGVLGITVLRDTIGPAMFVFKTAKEKLPCLQTVMGGAVFSDHLLKGSPNFDYFLEKTPYIDKIIIGEGQNLFLRLLRGQLPWSQRVFTLKDIGGESLGFSPLNVPDMSDFNIQRDYPYLAAQVSASCPKMCSFCNVVSYFGRYREKEVKQAVEEMIALHKKYGLQLFFMNDALLNRVAPAFSEEFIKSDIALYWDGYLRVDDAVCDIANTMQWRRGGFYRARLGVESGSQHVLDLINKGITPQQIKDSLFSLASAGIKTTAYWVIGHPGETEDDFLQTLELLKETKDYIYEAECNPFIYGFGGQSHTGKWENKRTLLYPESAKDMLIVQSWTVDGFPSRKETYDRVDRFVRLCKELGIPNPYSLHDIHRADNRWQRLHKNAVPRLVDFNERYIDECKRVKELVVIEDNIEEEGDFAF